MERDGFLRSLGVDAERVVRSVRVQRQDVDDDHADDDERQQVVQREEAVQRRIVDREAAPQPRHDRLADQRNRGEQVRSEEHTSELQSIMRTSYAVFCLKKKTKKE